MDATYTGNSKTRGHNVYSVTRPKALTYMASAFGLDKELFSG
jgi:hypothetical protein